MEMLNKVVQSPNFVKGSLLDNWHCVVVLCSAEVLWLLQGKVLCASVLVCCVLWAGAKGGKMLSDTTVCLHTTCIRWSF